MLKATNYCIFIHFHHIKFLAAVSTIIQLMTIKTRKSQAHSNTELLNTLKIIYSPFVLKIL